MTKNEVVLLVDRILSTWAVDISMNQKKTTYESWYRIVKDLDFEQVSEVLDLIIIEDKPWAPRPGTVRRRTINHFSEEPVPPEGPQAWADYRASVVAANNGEHFRPLHPLIRETIHRSGADSQVLHTNGDREIFLKIYETVLSEAELQRYRISE